MFVFVAHDRTFGFLACLLLAFLTRIDSLILQHEQLFQLVSWLFFLTLGTFGSELTGSYAFVQQLNESYVSVREVL